MLRRYNYQSKEQSDGGVFSRFVGFLWCLLYYTNTSLSLPIALRVSGATGLVFKVVFSFEFAELSWILLSSIVTDEDVWNAKLWEDQLHSAHDITRSCRAQLSDDGIWTVIIYNEQIFITSPVEHVWTNDFRRMCRINWGKFFLLLCSLVMLTHITLLDHVVNVCIDSAPIHGIACSQLKFFDALMSGVYLHQNPL